MHQSQATASSESHREPKRSLDSPSEPSKLSKVSKSLGGDEEGEVEGREEGAGGGGMNPNPRIQRYLVAVEYVGTRFSGSAKQPNCRTVVGALEEAFQKFVGQPVSIICSSRTDAGVHALSNVCHVDVERISKRKPGEVLPPHEPGVVRRAVNHFLQREGDIKLIDVWCVPADFHARFKALERTYFYRLLSGPEPLSTFEKDRAWHVTEELDLIAMKKACSILVGHHDFSSFRATGCQAATMSDRRRLDFLVNLYSFRPTSERCNEAKSPMKTLDELHVCEVVPSLYFPSIVERREMKSYTGSLAYSDVEFESSTACSSASHMNSRKCSLKSNHEFGHRPRHRCYVITARARSFLYHQVRLLVGVLKCAGTGDLTICDVERILDAKAVTAASPMAPGCGLYLGNVKYDIPENSES